MAPNEIWEPRRRTRVKVRARVRVRVRVRIRIKIKIKIISMWFRGFPSGGEVEDFLRGNDAQRS
jgi:hypothetical protein